MAEEPDVPKDRNSVLSVSASASRQDAPFAELQAGTSDASGKLLIWLSPAFPIGSFAFSHGLEWAVHAGRIDDAATTVSWLGSLLDHGALRNDAIFSACAWKAANVQDADQLREVNELALAMAGSKERHLETTAQGNAFVAIVRDAWHRPGIDWAIHAVHGDFSYPVAVGAVSAAHRISQAGMVRSFALAQVQNLVSAVIRLSVIGHTDGQRVIAALLPSVRKLGDLALTAKLDEIGSAAFQSDIASMKHETQYSRLFRS